MLTTARKPNRNRPISLGAMLSIALILTFSHGPIVSGQCQYEVTAIITSPPCPFGGTSPLIGSGLNENGEVVGRYSACPGCGTQCWDSAFFWSADTGLITLPKPDGVTIMRASSINDHRQIVGEMLFSGVGWRGFMYDMKAGEFQFLEPAIASGQAYARSINNAGIVAGARSTKATGPSNYNAVIWDTNTGEVIDLGLMNGPNSTAMDINAIGDAVGWAGTSIISSNVRAILWKNGKGYDLGVLPGMTKSVGKHIDDKTEVIGLSSPPTGTGLHFRWNDGKLSPMNPPDGYDLIGTTDMNNSGQITGHIRVAGTSAFHPFLSQHGEFHNLNTLIVGDAPTINHGSVLNESGHILAAAGSNAVLLTPIDVPFADLNFDCTVDTHDLLILLESWAAVEGTAAGSRRSNNAHRPDLNGDGVVDGHDLLILLANWG